MPGQITIPDPDPRLQKRYYLEMTLTRRFLTALARGIYRVLAVSEVRGLHHLPEDGAAIIAANHLNLYDVFPLQFAIPRPIFFMGKAELFIPAFDPLFRRMGGFPVYRGESDQWAIDHARKILAHGQLLGIFPEGTRSHGKGLRAAKTGAARLALATHSPIVPVAIHGQEQILQRALGRANVTVQIGAPLLPQADESPMELTDRIMFAMAALLPLELRGVYRERPPGF